MDRAPSSPQNHALASSQEWGINRERERERETEKGTRNGERGTGNGESLKWESLKAGIFKMGNL